MYVLFLLSYRTGKSPFSSDCWSQCIDLDWELLLEVSVMLQEIDFLLLATGATAAVYH